MAQTGSSGHGVLAVYPDMDAARDAMTTLESKGIDAVNIHLVGEAAERASADPDVSRRDRRVVGFMTARTIAGAAIGAIVGALLGLLAGSLTNGPAWIYMLAGIVFLGPFGFAVAGYSTLDADREWELTFEPDDGQVAIQVRTDDRSVVERASAALRDSGALDVKQL